MTSPTAPNPGSGFLTGSVDPLAEKNRSEMERLQTAFPDAFIADTTPEGVRYLRTGASPFFGPHSDEELKGPGVSSIPADLLLYYNGLATGSNELGLEIAHPEYRNGFPSDSFTYTDTQGDTRTMPLRSIHHALVWRPQENEVVMNLP